MSRGQIISTDLQLLTDRRMDGQRDNKFSVMMGVSGPSLLIESTDSMMIMCVQATHPNKGSHSAGITQHSVTQ